MSYTSMKKELQRLIDLSYQDFIQALVSIEKSIEDREYLEDIYISYMDKDAMGLLNDEFDRILKMD